jgi:Tol biopolymer transport system component
VIENASHEDYYFAPTWSPDGQYIYYGHYIQPVPTVVGPAGLVLERIAYPNGQPQLLISNGLVTHLTPDNSAMVYIWSDPNTYLNNLYAANPDGSNPTSILPADTMWAIDSFAISPDSQYVVFSADSSGPLAAVEPWYYGLLGIQVAEAHSIPEDLWRVPLAGGAVERLTNLGASGPAVSYSPDGQYIAFAGVYGLSVLGASGGSVTHLSDAPLFGSLQWLP